MSIFVTRPSHLFKDLLLTLLALLLLGFATSAAAWTRGNHAGDWNPGQTLKVCVDVPPGDAAQQASFYEAVNEALDTWNQAQAEFGGLQLEYATEDCDVNVHWQANSPAWGSTAAGGPPVEVTIESNDGLNARGVTRVLIHEFGHVEGLGHSAASDLMKADAYTGNPGSAPTAEDLNSADPFTVPTADDKAGKRTMYGTTGKAAAGAANDQAMYDPAAGGWRYDYSLAALSGPSYELPLTSLSLELGAGVGPADLQEMLLPPNWEMRFHDSPLSLAGDKFLDSDEARAPSVVEFYTPDESLGLAPGTETHFSFISPWPPVPGRAYSNSPLYDSDEFALRVPGPVQVALLEGDGQSLIPAQWSDPLAFQAVDFLGQALEGMQFEFTISAPDGTVLEDHLDAPLAVSDENGSFSVRVNAPAELGAYLLGVALADGPPVLEAQFSVNEPQPVGLEAEWMINEDYQQRDARAASDFDMYLKGDVRDRITGGGGSSVTNPFADPQRVDSLTSIGNTQVLFKGSNLIPQDLSHNRHFGIYGSGRKPRVLFKAWTYPTSPYMVPIPKANMDVTYNADAQSLTLSVENLSEDTVSLSQSGYLLAENPYSLHQLSRAYLPPETFIPLPDLDREYLPGESASLTLHEVAATQYLVTYSTQMFSGASAANAYDGTGGAWAQVRAGSQIETPPLPAIGQIQLLEGDGQEIETGQDSAPLRWLLLDEFGQAISGLATHFTLTTPLGEVLNSGLNPQQSLSNASGEVATQMQAVATAGTYQVSLVISDDPAFTLSVPLSVRAAEPPLRQLQVASGDGQQVTVGQSAAPVIFQLLADGLPLTDTRVEFALILPSGELASEGFSPSGANSDASGQVAVQLSDAQPVGLYTLSAQLADDSTVSAAASVEILPASVPQQPPLGAGLRLGSDGTLQADAAQFYGGFLLADGGLTPHIELNAGAYLHLRGTIAAAADVGQSADLLLVFARRVWLPPDAPSAPLAYFMLDGDGNIQPWDMQPATLQAFQTGVPLSAAQAVDVQWPSWELPGELQVFFGYRNAAGVVFNGNLPLQASLLPPLPDLGNGLGFDAQGAGMAQDSVFFGGLSDGGDFLATLDLSAAGSPLLGARGIIYPDPQHVGQAADLLVVAEYRPLGAAGTFLMLREDGALLPWDLRLDTLQAFRVAAELPSALPLTLYEAALPPLMVGDIALYFGYRLHDGSLVHVAQALVIHLH